MQLLFLFKISLLFDNPRSDWCLKLTRDRSPIVVGKCCVTLEMTPRSD